MKDVSEFEVVDQMKRTFNLNIDALTIDTDGDASDRQEVTDIHPSRSNRCVAESVHIGSSTFRFTDQGGALLSWIHGQDIVLAPDESYEQGERSVLRGGIPILAPSCSVGGEFQFGSIAYHLGLHGFVRDKHWTINPHQTHADCIAYSMVYHHDLSSEIAESFPFPFDLRVTYNCYETKLRIDYQFQNIGMTPMPLQFGIHPYLKLGDPLDHIMITTSSEDEWFSCAAYINQVQQVKMDSNHIVHQKCEDQAVTQSLLVGASSDLKPQMWQSIASYENGLMAHHSHRQSQVYIVRGSQTNFKWTAYGFPYTILWLYQDQILCIEPWTAPPLAHQTGIDLIVIEPHETWRAQFELEIKV